MQVRGVGEVDTVLSAVVSRSVQGKICELLSSDDFVNGVVSFTWREKTSGVCLLFFHGGT